jgi:hypothetical protein
MRQAGQRLIAPRLWFVIVNLAKLVPAQLV